MHIFISKSHMDGDVWRHAGDVLLNVEEIRANELIRGGLARPAETQRVRSVEEKPAPVAKNKAAAKPSTKALEAKADEAAASGPPANEKPADGDLAAQGPIPEPAV